MKSDGTPSRAIVHIEDISRAFTAVAEAKRELVHDKAFNVGQTKENYHVSDIAEIVAETVPNCEDRIRARRRPGSALLSRELRQAPARAAGVSSRKWTARAAAKAGLQAIKKFGLTRRRIRRREATRACRT